MFNITLWRTLECLLSCHHPSHTLPPLLSPPLTHLASSLVTTPHTPCLLSCHHPSHTLPPLLSPPLTHLASSLVTTPHTPCLLSCHHPSHTLPPLLSPPLTHLAFHRCSLTLPTSRKRKMHNVAKTESYTSPFYIGNKILFNRSEVLHLTIAYWIGSHDPLSSVQPSWIS